MNLCGHGPRRAGGGAPSESEGEAPARNATRWVSELRNNGGLGSTPGGIADDTGAKPGLGPHRSVRQVPCSSGMHHLGNGKAGKAHAVLQSPLALGHQKNRQLKDI